MATRTKVILLLLFTLGYFWVCHYIYTCWLRPVCYGCGDNAALVAEDRSPLVFEWSNSDGITNNKFPDYKANLLSKGQNGDILEITGYYFADEKNTSDFDNLGLARANSAKQLMMPDVSEDRIRLKSQLVEEKEGVRENYFESAELNWTAGFPMVANWSNNEVTTGEGFPAYKANTLTGMTDDNILEIVGYYYEGEAKPDGFPNMGLARANRIKQLMMPDVPEDRIRLRARQIDEKDGVRDHPFASGELSWKAADAKAAQLEELDDRVVIRFPFGSTKRITNPELEEYLLKLADRVKKSGEKISLTGHTDNKGDTASNQKLGLRRAKVIQRYLVSKGVEKSLISIDSKGETQPIASNDTDEGRQENRRTEVRLLKGE